MFRSIQLREVVSGKFNAVEEDCQPEEPNYVLPLTISISCDSF